MRGETDTGSAGIVDPVGTSGAAARTAGTERQAAGLCAGSSAQLLSGPCAVPA